MLNSSQIDGSNYERSHPIIGIVVMAIAVLNVSTCIVLVHAPLFMKLITYHFAHQDFVNTNYFATLRSLQEKKNLEQFRLTVIADDILVVVSMNVWCQYLHAGTHVFFGKGESGLTLNHTTKI